MLNPNPQLAESISALKGLLLSQNKETRIKAIMVSLATGCEDLIPSLGLAKLQRVLYGTESAYIMTFESYLLDFAFLTFMDLAFLTLSKDQDNIRPSYDELFARQTLKLRSHNSKIPRYNYRYFPVDIISLNFPNLNRYLEKFGNPPSFLFVLFTLIRAGYKKISSFLHVHREFTEYYFLFANEYLPQSMDKHDQYIQVQIPNMALYRNYFESWFAFQAGHGSDPEIINRQEDHIHYLENSEYSALTLTHHALQYFLMGDPSKRDEALSAVVSSVANGKTIYAENLVDMCLLFPKLWSLEENG